jgi:hypothetical protein
VLENPHALFEEASIRDPRGYVAKFSTTSRCLAVDVQVGIRQTEDRLRIG